MATGRSLKDLLYKAGMVAFEGNLDIIPISVTADSRAVSQNTLFVAVRGTASDGHQYIDKAIAQGASAIVAEELPAHIEPNVVYIQVADSSEALGQIASNFYGNPSSKLVLVGVTGTNGKTTVATLLYKLFRGLGYSAGLLSTVQNQINDRVIPATHTTPEAVSLNKLLAEMVDAGCTHCFMECSSHAIVQRRIAGLDFNGALFTNITHEHLDYHGTFDNYIKAKKMFFDYLPSTAFAITNLDDKRGTVMVQNTKATIKTYSVQKVADFKARVLSNSLNGLQLDVDGSEVWFKLVGSFNASNLMAVYGAALMLGEDREQVLTVLSGLNSVNGRFDRYVSPNGITVIVDYAHTPDALENVLGTIKDLRTMNEQLITLFGCGGERDRAKRPVMVEIALKFSNKLIMTLDNPRHEDPEQIFAEMQKGVSPSNFKKAQRIDDRREAILHAISISNPGDIILIAGKGHEDYQVIGSEYLYFSDKEVVAEGFSKLS
jgi:UDP-N-acetylmuramoyl-L-alanyl-D-glutamate--2,6-diaminopimelate ligase